MSSTVLVTGADHKLFLMACGLMQTLRRWAEPLPFYVMDFGLTPEQRDFLRAQGTLLERPTELVEGLHPFHYKAAMGRFVRDLDWQTVVWIDCDMVAVGPLAGALAALLPAMEQSGAELALCRDTAPCMADVVGAFDMAPFVEALARDGVSLDGPYYNTGLVVFRSRDFLTDWDAVAQSWPQHILFEQNALNLLVRRRGALFELPAAEWNRHAELLGMGLSGAPLLLHATSSGESRHIYYKGPAGVGDASLECVVKFFRDPALRDVQLEAMVAFVAASHDALHQYGVLTQTDQPGIRPFTLLAPPPAQAGNFRACIRAAVRQGSAFVAETACLAMLHQAEEPELRFLLGLAQNAQNQRRQALDSLAAAARGMPDRADVAHEHASALRAAGRLAEAVAEWRRCLALVPDWQEGWRHLASALVASGDLVGGLDALSRAIPGNAASEAHSLE